MACRCGTEHLPHYIYCRKVNAQLVAGTGWERWGGCALWCSKRELNSCAVHCVAPRTWMCEGFTHARSWLLAPALSALGRLSALTLKPREASRLLGRAAHLPALAKLELVGIDCQGAGARRTLLTLVFVSRRHAAPFSTSMHGLLCVGCVQGLLSFLTRTTSLEPCWRLHAMRRRLHMRAVILTRISWKRCIRATDTACPAAGDGRGLWHSAAAPALTALAFRGHETGGLPPETWPRLSGCAGLARLELHAVLELPAELAAAVRSVESLEVRRARAD